MIAKRKFLSVTAALGIALIVGACSSSSKSSTGGTSNATTATTGSAGSASGGTSASSAAPATGAPIKFGVICSCSGTFADVVLPAQETFRAWVDTTNASGGIAGHQIQLVLKDDAANPGTSVSEVQSLISSKVVGIADFSIASSAWAPAVQAAGIPVIAGNSSEPPFFTNPDFYSQGTTSDAATIGAGIITAKNAGASSVSLFYCAEAQSCAAAVSLVKASAAKEGLPNPYNAAVSATAPNYTAQCVAAKQANVGAIIGAVDHITITRIAGDCETQGFHPDFVQPAESFTVGELTTPSVKTNLYLPFPDYPFFDTSSPLVQQMNTALDKYYPGLRTSASYSGLAGMGWPSGVLLGAGIQAGGLTASDTPSAAEFQKGLESFNGNTLGGWAPPLTFPAGKAHPIDCWFNARMQNGVPALLDGGKVSCLNGSSS